MQLQELAEFCNGDSAQTTITHYCVRGVCTCGSDNDALERVTNLAIPLVCRGYQTPLLYRFTHYELASSWIKVFCCFYELMPQALCQLRQNMENGTDAGGELSSFVEAILQQNVDEGHFNQGSPDEQSRLDDLLDNDLSFGLQNSIRKNKVIAEMTRPEFCQSSMTVDSLVNALEYGSNLLFKRTSLLTRLASLGRQHSSYPQLADESLKYFCQIVSGSFGRTLMRSTANLLKVGIKEMTGAGFNPSVDQMDLYFRLVVATTSDVWRRLVWEFESFPFKWFNLLPE